ncbi:MAG: cell division protein [Alphaproteobacteria bacterium]|nr:cell division protein [Alphaproteobacteria bacterium]
MFKYRYDIPFAKDTTGFFLPWLIMLMVFLASLALTGAMGIDTLLSHWNRDISGSLTVQIIPPANQKQKTYDKTASNIETALILLKETHGVESARVLSKGELKKLLEPWLGKNAILDDLPIPQLIDVTLDEDKIVDLKKLAEKLEQHVQGATLDNHRVWLSKLIYLARSLEFLASSVVALVIFATSTTVVYATKSSLTIHKPVIEVLHLVGARDNYIAKQFAWRALLLGLMGGAAGIALAVPTAIAIGTLARRLEGGLVSEVGLNMTHWAIVCTVPIIAALLTMITARITVLRTLGRML